MYCNDYSVNEKLSIRCPTSSGALSEPSNKVGLIKKQHYVTVLHLILAHVEVEKSIGAAFGLPF